MTPRLRELEATAELAKSAPFSPYNTLPASTDGMVRGYKLAQEDLKPVLDAAEELKIQVAKIIHVSMLEEGNAPIDRAWLALRDALAGMEE